MSGSSPRLATGGFAAAAGGVAIMTLLSRLVGLARWVVFSSMVGATCVGDAYATTNQLPNVLYEVAVGGALAAVIVPIVARYLAEGDERSADAFGSAALTWAISITLPIALLLMVTAGPISGALMGSSQGCSAAATADMAALMLLLFAPQIVFYAVGVVLTGILQAHRRFLAAATAPLLSSVVVIATYFAFGQVADPAAEVASTASIVLLAGGTTLGVVAMSLPLIIPAWRTGARMRLSWRFPDDSARIARALALAGVIAVAAQQLTVLLTIVASRRVDLGVVNAYNYTQTVYLLPYAVLVVPVATVAFPRLADKSQASQVLSRTASLILVTGTAAALILIASREQIGDFWLAIDAGGDGPGNVALRASPTAIAAFAPGLVGFGLMALASRALYAAGRPRRAAIGQSLAWVVAGLGPLIVWFGGAGWGAAPALATIGLASSLGMTVGGLVLARWASQEFAGAQLGPPLRLLASLGVTAILVLAAPLLWPYDALAGASTWWGALISAGLISVAALLTLALVLAVIDRSTYRSLGGAVTQRLRRRSH